jgi:hypothetical protein
MRLSIVGAKLTKSTNLVCNIYALCPILHYRSKIVFFLPGSVHNKFCATMLSLKTDIGTRNLLKALFKAEIHICYLESIRKKKVRLS